MNNIAEAIRIMREGGIVIFPTDTAFGIGCRIDDANAVRRLFAIRKRPPDQAVPVLVESASMAQNYWDSPIPDNVRRIINSYWPGALTVAVHIAAPFADWAPGVPLFDEAARRMSSVYTAQAMFPMLPEGL